MTAFRGVMRQSLLMLLSKPTDFEPFSRVANILNFATRADESWFRSHDAVIFCRVRSSISTLGSPN